METGLVQLVFSASIKPERNNIFSESFTLALKRNLNFMLKMFSLFCSSMYSFTYECRYRIHIMSYIHYSYTVWQNNVMPMISVTVFWFETPGCATFEIPVGKHNIFSNGRMRVSSLFQKHNILTIATLSCVFLLFFQKKKSINTNVQKLLGRCRKRH